MVKRGHDRYGMTRQLLSHDSTAAILCSIGFGMVWSSEQTADFSRPALFVSLKYWNNTVYFVWFVYVSDYIILMFRDLNEFLQMNRSTFRITQPVSIYRWVGTRSKLTPFRHFSRIYKKRNVALSRIFERKRRICSMMRQFSLSTKPYKSTLFLIRKSP
jgi:hypothetical protein